MTGQIPPYGKNFRLDDAGYSTTRSHSVYVLKRDGRWFIQSDKTSKQWTIYLIQFWPCASYGAAEAISGPHRSLTVAMETLLTGIEQGFYRVTGQEPTPASAQEEGIQFILGAVAGTVFRSDAGEAIVFLDRDPYVIRVDEDGGTTSAYLVTVPPADIAAAMDADAAEIGGWSTGYDI